eukprot:382279_1
MRMGCKPGYSVFRVVLSQFIKRKKLRTMRTMLLLHILLHSSLLFINDALTTLTYTTSSPASSINCGDLTGCEIICTGEKACEKIAINATSASYLTITASGVNVLWDTSIYCPSNGMCDISADGKYAFSTVDIFAQTSTKLTVTADGGHQSFSPYVYCPRNQETPSCIIRLRSDSSPFWSSSDGGPITFFAYFYIDSADELEFQCDADTNWDALFGIQNRVFYHDSGDSYICDIELGYDSGDFFATNLLICNGLFNNKRCVPWLSESTESPTNTPSASLISTKTPSVLPSEAITNFPILSPSKHTTISPTKLDTISPTKAPTRSPTDLLSTTSNPSLTPLLIEQNPTETAIKSPTIVAIQSKHSTTRTASPHITTGQDEEKGKQNKLDIELVVNIALISILILAALAVTVILAHKYGFKKYEKSVDEMNVIKNNENSKGRDTMEANVQNIADNCVNNVETNKVRSVRNEENVDIDNVLQEGEFVVGSDSDSDHDVVEIDRITAEGPSDAIEKIYNKAVNDVDHDSADCNHTQTTM